MAYRLKTIRYQGSEKRILLQNENGPCPLLAACNALLLRGDVEFPPSCVRNSVASLDDVTNLLADQALRHLQSTKKATTGTLEQQHEQHDYFLHELLTHIPTFQYGMDVNPSLTCGIDGYEWTAQLSAFDMLRVKLVHGWLVDPNSQGEIYHAVGSECYNSLVERIIESREAASELEAVQVRIATAASGGGDPESFDELQKRAQELAQQVTRGTLIDDFLNSASHQLTDYGLSVLHEQIKEGEMVVFFRNNHFGTLTKHKGLLYLLVTDLGYANTPDIVWEKLDVIDGDTELANSEFLRAGEQASLSDSLMSGPTLSPEQLLAQSSQTDADYHLALHLSMQDQDGLAGTTIQHPANKSTLDDEEGQLIAAATEESLRTFHGISPETSSQRPPPPPDVEMEDATKSGAIRIPPSTPGGGTSSGNAGTVVSLPPAGLATTGAGAIDPSRVTVAVGIPLGSTVNDTVQLMNRHAPGAPAPEATKPPANPHQLRDEQQKADELLAMQLQNEQDEASLHLARQLQAEEDGRGRTTQQPAAPNVARPAQQRQTPQRRPPRATASSSSGNSNKESSCVIS